MSLLTSTLPAPSQPSACCRQRRKEELIESELEPVPNLIGLGDYFMKRPHFVYRPRSTGGGEASTSTEDLYNGGHDLDGASCHSRTRGTPQLPRSFSSTTPVLQHRSSIRGPTLPLGVPPSSAVRRRAAGFSGQSRPSQRTDTGAPAADHNRGVNGAPSSPGEAAGGVHAGEPSSSSRHSASTFSLDSEDVFFDEDPLAAQLLQGPEAAKCPATMHTPASVQAAREHERVDDQAASGTRAAPALEPLVVESLSSSAAQHALVPRAPETPSDPVASFSSFPTDPTSSAAAGQSAAPATLQPPSRSTLFLRQRSPSPWDRRRTIDNLLHKLLRLRVQYERARHQGHGPCGVCDKNFREQPLYARSRGAAAQGERFSSPAIFAATVRPHSRRGCTQQQRQQPHARPASRASQRSGLCSGCGHCAPHIRSALDVCSADQDVSLPLFRGYRRCECCECCEVLLPHNAAVPMPPTVPRDGASLAPRQGRRRPSSATPPAAPPRQRSSRMPDPFAAPRPTPSYWSPYHSETASHRRPSARRSEGGDSCRGDVRDEARAQRELDLNADDYSFLIKLVRGIGKDIRAEQKGSEASTAEDTACRATSGATDRGVEALLRALREEARMYDATYAELLRVLHGSGQSRVSGSSAASASELTSTAVVSPYNIPHSPFVAPPRHAAERCDAAVATMASPPSPPEMNVENHHARGGIRGTPLQAFEETLPSAPAAILEPLHAGEGVPCSQRFSSISSNKLSSDSCASGLAAPAVTPQGETDASAPGPVTELHPTTATTPAALDAVFDNLVHESVQQSQLRLIDELEGALRARLGKDEEDARWEVCRRGVDEEELQRRRVLALDEAVKGADLARQWRYLRARIFVAETALNEWKATLKTEEHAHERLTENAGLAAAAEGPQRGIHELCILEESDRCANVWAELLIRQKLQVSLCSDAEECARVEIEFEEQLKRTKWIQIFIVCCLAQTRAARDATPIKVDRTEWGGGNIGDMSSTPPLTGEQLSAPTEDAPTKTSVAGDAPECVAAPPLDTGLSVEKDAVEAAAPPAEDESVADEHARGKDGRHLRPFPAFSVNSNVPGIIPPRSKSPSICASSASLVLLGNGAGVPTELHEGDEEQQRQSVAGHSGAVLTVPEHVSGIPICMEGELESDNSSEAIASRADVASLPMETSSPAAKGRAADAMSDVQRHSAASPMLSASEPKSTHNVQKPAMTPPENGELSPSANTPSASEVENGPATPLEERAEVELAAAVENAAGGTFVSEGEATEELTVLQSTATITGALDATQRLSATLCSAAGAAVTETSLLSNPLRERASPRTPLEACANGASAPARTACASQEQGLSTPPDATVECVQQRSLTTSAADTQETVALTAASSARLAKK